MSGFLTFLEAAPPDDGRIAITHDGWRAILDDVAAHLRNGRGFTLATLNLDHAVKLRGDEAFRSAYRAHSHVVADGNPIVWLSRLAGRGIELVPGSELIDPLVAVAAEQGVPVALIGSQPAVLDAAAHELKRRHPDLTVSLRISPAFGFDPVGAEADGIVERIAASNARLCFLALGAPRQEVFAAHAARSLPDRGFVSIGAGLDFIAGHQKRAPVWVRKLAAEWLWRMMNNPARLARRYGACAAILPSLTIDALRERKRR